MTNWHASFDGDCLIIVTPWFGFRLAYEAYEPRNHQISTGFDIGMGRNPLWPGRGQLLHRKYFRHYMPVRCREYLVPRR